VTSHIQEKALKNQGHYSALQKTVQQDNAIPKNFTIDELEPMQVLMNDMMINYVDKVRKEPERFIIERSCMERVFNLVPSEITNNHTMMYKN
jgi:hypothetical protein